MTHRKVEFFTDWLDEELRKRDWSDYELAKRAKISHSVLTRARQGTIPKWAACAAIAEALNLPFELVFRRAGLISRLATTNENIEELVYLFDQLAPRYQNEAIEFIRNRLQEQGKFNQTIDELRSVAETKDIKALRDIFLGYSSHGDNDKQG